MSDTLIADDTLAPDEVLEGSMPDADMSLLDDSFSSSDYQETPKDWGFLEETASGEDYDPDETIEQAMAREEAKAKAQEGTEPGKTDAPAAKAEDTKPSTQPAPEDVARKVQAWDTFADMLQNNPHLVVDLAVQRMSDSQKSVLLQSLGATTTPATTTPKAMRDLPADYVPSEGMEEVLLERWDHIRSIPDMQKQIAELSNGLPNAMKESMRELHTPIGAAVVHAEIGLAKLDAICEVLGIDLPTPDLAALSEILNDGRTTARSAVKRLTEAHYKKTLSEYKQSRAERPKTPGNSSTRQPKPEGPADMVQIMEEMGLLRR